MQEREKITVYLRVEKGKTVCMCHTRNKKCSRPCDTDIVERDRFREWETTMRRDTYDSD